MSLYQQPQLVVMLSIPGKVTGLASLDAPTFPLHDWDPQQTPLVDGLNLSSLFGFKSSIKK